MGLLDRIIGRTVPAPRRETRATAALQVTCFEGRETLEVVGESHYQDQLWRAVGGFQNDRVRHDVLGVLVPEPANPQDENAIMVVIDTGLVGYLAREDAAAYLPGLERLMRQHSTHIGLSGVIVGGGQRADGPGMLGVFLDHDPTDFGISRDVATHIGELRTGLSEAIQTDLEDDTYDLSWLSALSGTKSPADIVTLRKLLEAENDPIDRHFMLAELGGCLYRCRAAFSSALEEFDAVCEQHHVEMEATIRAALYSKFESVPLVEMYRQATIRWQKAHDWERMETWATRGLAMYGENPARPEAVEDLAKRLAYAQAKLAAPAKRPGHRAETKDPRQSPAPATEVLTCATCGNSFERQRTRGRKPTRCPVCSGSRGYVSA